MRKWVGPFFSLLLVLFLISFIGPSQDSERSIGKKEEGRIAVTQYREGAEKRGEKDSHLVQLLKELKETVDGWLKSLNERIEREDVTRFEVRFLEILRSILEWMKEKIDSQIEASDADMQEQKRKGRFREIHQKVSPFPGLG